MNARDITRLRLANLLVAASDCKSAGDVVAKLGAMQGQDYAGGLWAIGLRLPGAKLASVEAAVADRSIVRTWPMRGTLHFVAAADAAWMLDLLAPRVIRSSAKRHQQLELDVATFKKVEKVCGRVLARGVQLTRDELREELARAKINTEGGRLYHCLWRLSQEKVLCSGVPKGKQPTFTLFDDWLPRTKPIESDEAVARLAARYYASHGPATQQDLMRWAGLTSAEVKLGIAGAGASLISEKIGGTVYFLPANAPSPPAAARGTFLLPGFDEYMLGYKDRSAFLAAEHADKIIPGGNGVFRATVVRDGQVIATWQATQAKKTVRVTPQPFARLPAAQLQQIQRAASGYAAFLGKALAS